MRSQFLCVCFGILSMGGCGADEEPIPQGRVVFGFPVAQPELIDDYIGFDHDPEMQMGGVSAAICTSYDGRVFPWCYDGHDGSDYTLEGGFDTMDNGSAQVVAAADGVVVSIHDGEYDRCHIDGVEVTCDGNPMIANRVRVDHGDGVDARYLHLKSGSIIVTEGQPVQCGDVLGLVGSSGNSSLPHLHFEVVVDGVAINPYAGEFSQEETWWADQGGPEEIPGPGCTAPMASE